MLRRVKLYRHLLHSCGVFLCDVFLVFFLDNFKSDCILQTLFLSKSDAVKSVWLAFENCVTVYLLFTVCFNQLHIICHSKMISAVL